MIPEIEPYYTDAEVARLLDPTGTRIKPRSIRSERDAGRLIATKVAGKWLYRKSDVLSFLEAARRCPDQTAASDLPHPAKGMDSGRLLHHLDRRRPKQAARDRYSCRRS